MNEMEPTTSTTPRARPVSWVRRILLGILITPFALALLGALYQSVSSALDRRSHPMPGQLVDVGGYRLHIYCEGEGSPTVILDAPNMGTVSNWAWIQPEVAKSTRVCAYDRADAGWSDRSPEANDTRMNSEALHALLRNADVAGPYILVGHSFGGLFIRAYADMYPDETAGMVFIEGTLPDGLLALGQPDVMPNSPGQAMIDSAPIVSRLGILRLMNFPATDPDLPEPQRSELQTYLSSTNWAESTKRQYHLFPTLLAQVRELYIPGSLGSIPVAVVVGSDVLDSIPQWRQLFDQQGALSSDYKMYIIEGGTHSSILDKQEHAAQTTRAILEVLEAVRSGRPVAGIR